MIKNCRVCDIEFNPRPYQIKYKHWICLPCKNKYKRKMAMKPSYKAKARETRAKWYAEGGIETVKACVKKYRKKKPMWQELTSEQKTAYQKVQNAKRRGELIIPGKCSRCGSPDRIEAHHHDYSKPLDVNWLCHKCHREEHSTIRDLGKSEG